MLGEGVVAVLRRARWLVDEPGRLLAVPAEAEGVEQAGCRQKRKRRRHLRLPQFPNVSMPSSRFARRFASAECWSSGRVLTAGIVFALFALAGGADCEGGGGDVEDEGPCENVPWRLNDTGLAVCVGNDGVDMGANGLFELA